MPKNGTLVNIDRPEVVNTVELLEVLEECSVSCHLSDVAPKNATAIKELVGDKLARRLSSQQKRWVHRHWKQITTQPLLQQTTSLDSANVVKEVFS